MESNIYKMVASQATLEELTKRDKQIFDELTAGIDLTRARRPIAPGKTGVFNFHLYSSITKNHPILQHLLHRYSGHNHYPEIGYDSLLRQYELIITVVR